MGITEWIIVSYVVFMFAGISAVLVYAVIKGKIQPAFDGFDDFDDFTSSKFFDDSTRKDTFIRALTPGTPEWYIYNPDSFSHDSFSHDTFHHDTFHHHHHSDF